MLPGVRRYFKHSSLMLFILTMIVAFFVGMCATANDVHAKPRPPKSSTKSKFYDFNDQLIDGQIMRPTALYTDARQRARFSRLLKLKKSFLPELFKTAKESVFK